MLFRQFLLCIFFCAYTITACAVDSAGFDNVCGFFEQLDKQTDVGTLSNTQRNDFIITEIDTNLPETSDARVAWAAIDSAVPEVRYALFKSAAESVLNKQWQCAAMSKWAPKTGEF